MEIKEPSKAYEKVIEYIKAEILHGNLKQGQKLPPERELAEQLGVSRNSVREALRTLDEIGIIISTQGVGNSVSCNFEKSLGEAMSMMFLMQKIDYEQLSELRRGLEEQAIMLAADRITAEQIHQLEDLVARLAVSEDEMTNVIMDKKLHYTIAQASGNQLILAILQALSDVMDMFISDLRKSILKRDKGGNRLQSTHESMVKCLKNGDKHGAYEAMYNHFMIIEENIVTPYKNA
jgi:GntR family transcriptional repressor for pyruvate dehydrogenase complex